MLLDRQQTKVLKEDAARYVKYMYNQIRKTK